MNYTQIQFGVTRPEVTLPLSRTQNNVGWEITLINREDNRAEDVYQDVNNFLTGITLPKHLDYYYEIVATPDLHKLGYMLPGTIVLNSSNGELSIPLYKFKDVEDIELPFAAVQLILMPKNKAYIIGKRETVKRRVNTYHSPQYEEEYESSTAYGASNNSRSTKTSNHMF